MNIIYCKDYQDMNLIGADAVLKQIKKRKKITLCAATGESPKGLYKALVNQYKEAPHLFKTMNIVKLDEWGGVEKNHPSTCEYYLRTRLTGPMNIPPSQFISFDSVPNDPAEECRRIQTLLEKKGPIDLCILGLGTNGHLGFNEPGASLNPHCHVAKLSVESLNHTMIKSLRPPPKYGLTLGIDDILRSKKIILLVTGQHKESVINQFLKGDISSSLPASMLWNHPNTTCLINEQAIAPNFERPVST